MARKKATVKQAEALLTWLVTLELPTRALNALRRDLEVVAGQREGEEGSGVLVGLDQARFAEELHRPGGGQVGKVPGVAKGAIEALRAAIPAPASVDSVVEAGDGSDLAPESAVVEEAMPEGAVVEAVEAMPEGADAEAVEAAPEGAVAEAVEAMPEGAVAEAVEAGQDDEAPEILEPAPEPAKRRGRPPRKAVTSDAIEPLSEAPAKRRGRPPRSDTAPAAPPAAVAAPQRAPAPVTPPAADPSFAVFLRLWRELHPQGRRAAMHFMADLAAEGAVM
jgi:hypothetical protein